MAGSRTGSGENCKEDKIKPVGGSVTINTMGGRVEGIIEMIMDMEHQGFILVAIMAVFILVGKQKCLLSSCL
jgi:hypothetical protein